MRTSPVAAVLALLVAAPGCSDGPATARGRPVALHGAPLVIREARAAQPLYVEGSIGYLRVVAVDTGAVLRKGRVKNAVPGTTRRLFKRFVKPGRYRIVSYQRPCDGNCSYLDGPTERCDTTIELRDNQPARVTLEVTPGAGCRIRRGLNDASRPSGRLE